MACTSNSGRGADDHEHKLSSTNRSSVPNDRISQADK